LGKRLVSSERAEPEDIEQLHRLLGAYGPVLAAAVELVAAKVGVVPSSRVKTTGTLIEKLRRNGGHTLSSIHDLGGMRLVVPGGRVEQDRIVDGVRELFSEAARMPKVIDRRANPVEGYRAVHVIIYPDGYPIEVQVRTQWQHLWAEWFERLADQYGRGIRYGDPPATGGETARDVVAQLIELADQIAAAEETGTLLPLNAVVMALVQSILNWLKARRLEE
jgi:ppGpp synthetase/RelA/SpoT-type nucleotidyltranferase